MIFQKPCPIFEHTFRVWCSIFDHQTQMTLHIERVLTVSVRNSNTSLESRVLFSSTFLESVIENLTPRGSLGKTCTIFEHGSGLGCANFDHLCSIHATLPHITLHSLRNCCPKDSWNLTGLGKGYRRTGGISRRMFLVGSFSAGNAGIIRLTCQSICTNCTRPVAGDKDCDVDHEMGLTVKEGDNLC